MRRSHKRAGAGRERGAVLVEAALLLPLVVFVVFGAVEFGFLFKAEQSVQATTSRVGRRIAQIPKSPDYVDEAGRVASRGLSVLNNGEPYRMMVYPVDPDQELPTGVTQDTPEAIWAGCAADTSDCVRWEWSDGAGELVQIGTPHWLASEMSACAPNDGGTGVNGALDNFVVYLWARYTPLTPLFDGLLGSPRDVTSRGYFQLDPYQGTEDCGGA